MEISDAAIVTVLAAAGTGWGVAFRYIFQKLATCEQDRDALKAATTSLRVEVASLRERVRALCAATGLSEWSDLPSPHTETAP